MTRDKEVWALALWVEKHQGADGPRYIAEQVGRLVLKEDKAGVDFWRAVAARWAELQQDAPRTALVQCACNRARNYTDIPGMFWRAHKP